MLKIEVLGPGCSKCDDTFNEVKGIVDKLRLEAELVKVTDVFQIIDQGINFTPALIIDGKIIFQGKVPKKEEIRKILKDHVSAEDKLE